MKSNTFKLLLITAGIIIVALCGLGGYLFMESQAMKEAEMANSTMEQAKKDSLKIIEQAELLRIANERETSIKKENEASAAREKATEDNYNELMAENFNQQNNNYSDNSQNNQAAQSDLEIIDKLEEIDKLISESQDKTTIALHVYMSAIQQYGTTIVAFRYQQPVHNALRQTQSLCREAIRYVNCLQTIDEKTRQKYILKYKNQEETCRNLGIEVSNYGNIR